MNPTVFLACCVFLPFSYRSLSVPGGFQNLGSTRIFPVSGLPPALDQTPSNQESSACEGSDTGTLIS